MIKKLIQEIFIILLPIFFVIPIITNAQVASTTKPFTIPSPVILNYNTGNYSSMSLGFASTSSFRFMTRSNGNSSYNSLAFPTNTYTDKTATTTITFTVTDFYQSGTLPSCQFALGYLISTIPTNYNWNPAFRSVSRTILNVNATGTYSITAPLNYSTDSVNGVVLSHSASGSGISYCDINITSWKINDKDIYNIINVPVAFGGSSNSSMGTTTIATSSVTDAFLFLLGIIASSLIFLLLVKIIWKR